MSAFGTEKFPTTSLRLGMPTAFQNAYARLGSMPRFAPDAPLPAVPITVGNDFQANWHSQKKADADRMVRAKVQSTTNMYNRANSAPNNSPGHQQAMLGQRIFANPSFGALSGISAREDYGDAPFHFSDAHGVSGGSVCGSGDGGRLVGGVLRSAQGQSYGMSLLQKRIGEFNRIAQEAEAFQMGSYPGMVNGEEAMSGQLGADAVPLRNYSQRGRFPGALPTPSQGLAMVPQVELSQLLQNIVDSLQEGEKDGSASRLTYQDSVRAFALLVRLATTAEESDIADVLEFINGTSAADGIIPKLTELVIEPITDDAGPRARLYLSLKEFWSRVKVYLEKMIKTVGMPYKNRASASQAYIKSLGFTKLFKGKMPAEFVNAQDAQQAVDTKGDVDRFRSPGPGAPRGDDDDDTSSGRSEFRAYSEFVPLRREDTQHGYRGTGGAEFSYDDRQRFGYASGEYSTGGRGVGYSGEEEVPYGEAPVIEEEEGPEEEDGEEEYVADATATNPSNAGPRLVSRMSPETGEWDISSPQRQPPRVGFQPPPSMSPATAPLPPFLQDRSALPKTIDGYIALAQRVNEYYQNNLPDGKGPINVSRYSLPKSVRTNFVRRLKIPS